MVVSKNKRPLGVTILAILFALGAIGSLVSLPGSIAGTTSAEVFGYILYGAGAAIAYLVVLVINALIVYSFIKGNMDWGWGLSIAWVAYTIINSIISLTEVRNIVTAAISRTTISSAVSAQAISIATSFTYVSLAAGIIIYLIIAYYLTRPKVKVWLGVK